MKKFLLFIFIFSYCQLWGQDFSFRLDTSATIRVDGKRLPNAWAGGLNSAQFSTIDLNSDGQADLVIFDRTSNKISTFLAVQQSNAWVYRHAPAYESLFPEDLENWMLLVDFDADGRKDLFTFTPQGIRLFRNETIGESTIAWKLVANPLYTEGFSGKLNLYVASSDIPAIVDADNDGDMDILTFDFSGNYVEYHKNFSVEDTGKTNGLIFKKQGFCWGDFFKEHCRDFRFDIDCQTGQIRNTTEPNGRVLHSGNSLLVLDLDGDSKKDVLFGHITCQNLAMLPNNGTVKDAKFKSAAYDFPTKDPINFSVFPAVYFEDLDFDGKKDLIAAPNTYQNEGNLIDFKHSSWFYKNTGSNIAPNLTRQQTDFLQNTMIDIGENAAPVLVDLDGDGDLDLLVGIGGERGATGYRGSIWYFKNIGNKTTAQFELQTTDYLNISQNLLITEIRPFVADMNGDGVPDLGFTANSFTGLEVRYVPNQAPRGTAFQLDFSKVVQLSMPNGVRNGDNPLFVDVDKDGDLDLLLGRSFGNVEYHRNIGTVQKPDFKLENDNYGGIQLSSTTRSLSLATADLNADNQLELLLADGNGYLRVYPNFRAQTGKFKADTNLIYDELSKTLKFNKLCGVPQLTLGDLNNDQLPELVIGATTGGLRLLKNTSLFVGNPTEPGLSGVPYPNPTNRFLYFNVPYDAQATLFNILGQEMLGKEAVYSNQEASFDLSNLSDGVYILRVVSDEKGAVSFRVLLRK